MSMNPEMDKNDYTDPICPFDTSEYEKEPPAKMIDVRRAIEKEDEFLSRNDYDGAERVLLYWLSEADEGHDKRGRFAILNELMGLYRKTGKKEEALKTVEEALSMVPFVGEDTTAAGTVYLNSATVYKTFMMSEESIALFEKARPLYEKLLEPGDERLGGLYNNMALTLVDLERFDEAEILYEKAMHIMEQIPTGIPECAVTWLNLADLYYLRDGAEASEDLVNECLDRAEALLDTPGLKHDGNYAFVCEKCAPSYDYYGRFFYAKELMDRAEEIYNRAE